MSAVFEMLASTAQLLRPQGYLTRYTDDLYIHDRRVIDASKANESYVWLIRGNGTQLKLIAGDADPLWITFWLEKRHQCSWDPPPKCFRIVVTMDGGAGGILNPITDERARIWAELPHPEGKRRKISLA